MKKLITLKTVSSLEVGDNDNTIVHLENTPVFKINYIDNPDTWCINNIEILNKEIVNKIILSCYHKLLKIKTTELIDDLTETLIKNISE